MEQKKFNKYIEFHRNSNKENKEHEYFKTDVINVGYNIVEMDDFKSYLSNFTVSYTVLTQISDDISIFDILNHYKIKTLTTKELELLNDVKLKNFKVVDGKITDLKFICFEISYLSLNNLNKVFKSSNRTYHKYKKEFRKFERSLLFKLKSTEKYEYNNRNCISYAVQMDLNGEMVYSPFEETYKNTKQKFESEYEFTQRIKKERWSEIKRKKALRSKAIKSLRLWLKLRMPRLPKAERKKIKKFNPEDLKKQKGWRRGQTKELQGLLYYNLYGDVDGIAPVKVPQKIKEKNSVVITTEKMEEKKKRALW